MPNRMNAKTHRQKYRRLRERDGECCVWCEKQPPEVSLEIHHINGNKRDHRLGNLQFLCLSCNRKESGQRRARWAASAKLQGSPPRQGLARNPSDLREGGEGKNPSQWPHDATLEVRDLVDFQAGSPEMAANDLFEPRFRDWVRDQLSAGRALSKRVAIYEGAEVVGCAAKTTREYLEKMLTLAGDLEEIRGPLRQRIVIFRSQGTASPGSVRRGQGS